MSEQEDNAAAKTDQLRELVPGHPAAVYVVALKEAGGRVEAAVDYLFALASQEQSEMLELSQPSYSRRRQLHPPPARHPPAQTVDLLDLSSEEEEESSPEAQIERLALELAAANANNGRLRRQLDRIKAKEESERAEAERQRRQVHTLQAALDKANNEFAHSSQNSARLIGELETALSEQERRAGEDAAAIRRLLEALQKDEEADDVAPPPPHPTKAKDDDAESSHQGKAAQATGSEEKMMKRKKRVSDSEKSNEAVFLPVKKSRDSIEQSDS